MEQPIKCFLVEPIYGDPLPDNFPVNCWPPHQYIIRWRRPDTGEEKPQCHQFGVGAMWFSTWYRRNMTWDNETEPHLIVCCPNGEGTRDWDIDSRCSNCGSPTDRLHRCWVRHGIAPDITVDKNGASCQAGGGSIQLPNWHGFLERGYLCTDRALVR